MHGFRFCPAGVGGSLVDRHLQELRQQASHMTHQQHLQMGLRKGMTILIYYVVGFFYCIAELAVKPCRSSRSNTRGGFEKIP